MTQTEHHAGPTCPFCDKPWSAGMIALYESMMNPDACACCGGPPAAQHVHVEPAEPVPQTDLCCDHCGRAIYRSLASHNSAG